MTTSTQPAVDLERLKEVTRGNAEKTQRMLTTFLKQSNETREALGPAIQSGKAPEVRQLVHKLVGAASSLGLVAVVPSLSQMEQMADGGKLEGVNEAFAEYKSQLERVQQFINEYLKSHGLPAEAARQVISSKV